MPTAKTLLTESPAASENLSALILTNGLFYRNSPGDIEREEKKYKKINKKSSERSGDPGSTGRPNCSLRMKELTCHVICRPE